MNPKLKEALDIIRKGIDALEPAVATVAETAAPGAGAIIGHALNALKAGVDAAANDADGGATTARTLLDTFRAAVEGLV